MNDSIRVQVSNSLILLLMVAMSLSVQSAPSSVISQGSYISHQVNVDANGQNIVGDKGNEPSIAVNPVIPGNIVIGWRRFDALAVANNKQGGYGYSFDGGLSWSNGILPVLPQQQRTDPSLDVDSQGNIYYQSMAHGSVNSSAVFKSSDGGISWSNPVHQFIGDKNWMAIDKTGGNSDGFIYSSWRISASGNPDPNYVPKYFIRSTDGGLSYQEPNTALPVSKFGFGRIAIGPQGDVYLAGVDETVLSVNLIGIIRKGHYFLKSTDAKDPSVSPTFSAKQVDLGGNVMWLFTPAGPNPLGADGDVQIATDQSMGSMRGNIYMMAYTQQYGWQEPNDPLDVNFVRSEDGGDTWSAPIRINDDFPSRHAFQWFPMMGVAPNSRIDAVWYDTRNGSVTPPYNLSQLFYAYSWDGGQTWSENKAVTPLFNSHLPSHVVNGEVRQADKLGDYTHLVSDVNGAHIAYVATFNGEQDVYYLNVFPDCNDNALSDIDDIKTGLSQDSNVNHIPDECEIVNIPGDLDADGDIDRDDMGIILAARNQPVSGEDDPRDMNNDGVITVRDARALRALCTRPRCAIQ
jgi:hypothetical protein